MTRQECERQMEMLGGQMQDFVTGIPNTWPTRFIQLDMRISNLSRHCICKRGQIYLSGDYQKILFYHGLHG